MSNYGKIFKFARSTARIFYPKYRFSMPEMVEGPVVFVSHHQNFFGPFVVMLWLPLHVRIWVLHVFFHQDTGFEQLYNYTFTQRFGMKPLLAKLLAHPLSSILSTFYQSARAIPVYRNSKKIVYTFKESVRALSKGENLLIFPDIDYIDDAPATKDLYNGYLYLEKYYYKETGQHVKFVPLSVSKNKKTITVGSAVQFRDEQDFKQELEIVNKKILAELNVLAARSGDLK